jgi:hypothetical protein
MIMRISNAHNKCRLAGRAALGEKRLNFDIHSIDMCTGP